MSLPDIQNELSRMVALPPDLIPLALLTAGAVILAFSIRSFVLRLVLRRLTANSSRIKWRRNSAYLAVFLLVLVLFPIWLPSLRTIAAFLGIFGAGVILVLKEVILNLAGWFFMVFRKPFEIGNRITVGSYHGDVLDIRLMDVSLIEVSSKEEGWQSTGRVIHVPNSFVFTTPFANASKEFAFNWNEIKVPLSPDSDWSRAVEIIEALARDVIEPISERDSRIQHSEKQYAIRFQRITPRVFVEFRHGAILLTLRHLVEARANRIVCDDKFWRAFLTRIGKERKISLLSPPIH